MTRRAMALGFAALLARAQAPVEFTCPMDREIRTRGPGKCPRCGMALVAGIRDHVEYPLEVQVSPPRIPAGRTISLLVRARHPKTGKPVLDFEIVHEKLWHLFLVSHDLEYFAHVHPEPAGGGSFRLETVLPRPGAYRLLADFYPKGGTPQLVSKVVTTAGFARPLEASAPRLEPDLAPKRGENLEAELTMEPPQPIAGKKTMMFFRLRPGDGLEPYLGAWGHMLAASEDLIDTIHAHPFLADGGPQVQFNLFFPRETRYRVWVQFQRQGVVNTLAFTVPATQLR
jgi:hypothetical protein